MGLCPRNPWSPEPKVQTGWLACACCGCSVPQGAGDVKVKVGGPIDEARLNEGVECSLWRIHSLPMNLKMRTLIIWYLRILRFMGAMREKISARSH
jgi:hypothetical protein